MLPTTYHHFAMMNLQFEGWDRTLATATSDEEHLTILRGALVDFHKKQELPNRITDYYEAQVSAALVGAVQCGAD